MTATQPGVDTDSISKDRYISRDFTRQENQTLWIRTWQMVCRTDELERTGDYVEYSVADQSVIVLRNERGGLTAVHNACQHRGTQLVDGSGSVGGNCLVCPFHSWRYDFDGNLVDVPAREEFAGLDESALGLQRVAVDTWGGWVFVNLDPQAGPLAEYLAPMAALIDPFEPEKMQTRWYKQTILPGNWKTAVEAFTESYHVPTVHTQLPWDPRGFKYFAHRGGHSHYRINAGETTGVMQSEEGNRFDDAHMPSEAEVLYGFVQGLAEGIDGISLKEDKVVARSLLEAPIPEGSSVGAEYFRRMYEHYAGSGVTLPPLTPEQALNQGGFYYFFPNFMMLPGFANLLVYRVRPGGADPDSCIWDVWNLKRYPDGHRRPRISHPTRVPHDDVDGWGLVLWQDFENIGRVQRGLHSLGFQRSTLNADQERSIVNCHREIDRYLALSGW